MAQMLLDELSRLDIMLVAEGNRLWFHPRNKLTPELIKQLKSHKAEILAAMADPWPDDYIEPDPCQNCNSLELWQNATDRWRCMKCDPPTKAIRLLERTKRIRQQYGLPET